LPGRHHRRCATPRQPSGVVGGADGEPRRQQRLAIAPSGALNMDPGTLAGIGLAFGAIFASMILEGGSPAAIMLIPPIVLVFGGTMGAAMAGGMLKDFLGIVGSFQRVFLGKAVASDALVDDIVKLAEKARREGLLALEDAMKDVENPFLKKGLQLA